MTFGVKKVDATAKKGTSLWQRLKWSLTHIHLVDKCLLILMAVLLAQSAFILLTNDRHGVDSNPIDVSVRTASASVFGYFLSANFVQCRNSKSMSRTAAPPVLLSGNRTGMEDAPQNSIGFACSDGNCSAPAETSLMAEPPGDASVPTVGRLQILVTTGIALFCLMMLILARNVPGEIDVVSSSTSAVLSQFRDFVSGSVGFLIGCPTPKGKE